MSYVVWLRATILARAYNYIISLISRDLYTLIGYSEVVWRGPCWALGDALKHRRTLDLQEAHMSGRSAASIKQLAALYRRLLRAIAPLKGALDPKGKGLKEGKQLSRKHV